MKESPGVGSIPGARTQKTRNVIRGSITTGPTGKGGGGPIVQGDREPQRGHVVCGSICTCGGKC